MIQHPDNCMCQDCIDARFDNSRNRVDEKKAIAYETIKEPLKVTTLKDLYKVRRNGRISIWGTALGFLSAFWEWFLIYILFNKIVNYFTHKIVPFTLIPFSIHPIYKVKIADGYALVLLSIPLIIWWAVCTALMVVATSIAISLWCIVGISYIILLTPFPIISLLYIPISIYSVIFELPASALNRDFGKRNKLYDAQVDDTFKTKVSHTHWGWIIWGIIALSIIITCTITWGLVGLFCSFIGILFFTAPFCYLRG
ncbi:MAG: hypothetical protein PHS93_09315 [Candidatus Omnitrophica bacterium]|nr:hypothetical protein [Candidatus Omnitrophota bacterium]MDD5551506.1 hypothetical protein [Candidatus Omnitrophota bacterium]